jgi:hypothetical protein
VRKKKFDCVEMMHQAADRIYEETKDLTHEELMAWWEKRNEEFRQHVEAARAQRDRVPSPIGRVGAAVRSKTFDCVEMKRRGADRIYEETKNLTHEELLAYWEQKNRELIELQKTLRARRAEPAAPVTATAPSTPPAGTARTASRTRRRESAPRRP